MNNNISNLYWLTRLDSLLTILIIFIIMLSISALIIFLWRVDHISVDSYESRDDKVKRHDLRKKVTKNYKWIIPLIVFLMIVVALIPSRKELIFIYAGGKTLNYVEKDSSLNKIPYQATKIVSDYLDKQIKGIKQKAE